MHLRILRSSKTEHIISVFFISKPSSRQIIQNYQRNTPIPPYFIRYPPLLQITKQQSIPNINIQLPVPELYVIYTGSRKSKPRTLRLSESFFNGKIADIEVKIRIIYAGKKGSILNQYIRFCKIFTKQIKLHGRTTKAIQETIRICNQYKVLTDYLKEREKEIMNIMTALFDQEEVTKALVKSKEIAAEKKGKEDGFKLGKEDGEIEEKRNTVRRCRKAGIPENQIAEITGLTLDDISMINDE